MYIVNSDGIEQIKIHLSRNHKNFDVMAEKHFLAWASEVERNISSVGSAEFWIRAKYSQNGFGMTCLISTAGIDFIDQDGD